MRSLQTQLENVRNHPAGFDYLRLVLAISVIAWHSVRVCYGPAAELYFWTGPARPLVCFILPGFFALSGFLVAGSLERNGVPEFAALRFMRIFPALAVEVVVSALVIGPALTRIPSAEYFASPVFFAYFLNAIGNIHYELPGLFLDTPSPAVVNLPLWTVPLELDCYIIVIALALLRMIKKPLLLFGVISISALLRTVFIYTNISPTPSIGPVNEVIIFSFLFDVSLFILRKYVPFSNVLFVISIIIYTICVMNLNFIYLAALPAAYLTVFIGLQDPPKTFFIRGSDYSYGIYLYGFPLQQAVSYLFPATRIWYVNSLIGTALAFLCAYRSWTFVELPVLRKRKLVLFIASSLSGGLVRAWERYVRAKIFTDSLPAANVAADPGTSD